MLVRTRIHARYEILETEAIALLAQLMADLILNGKTVKEEVRRFRQRFLDMQYCFRGEEFHGLVEKLHKLV